jgi:hypothetical protein
VGGNAEKAVDYLIRKHARGATRGVVAAVKEVEADARSHARRRRQKLKKLLRESRRGWTKRRRRCYSALSFSAMYI